MKKGPHSPHAPMHEKAPTRRYQAWDKAAIALSLILLLSLSAASYYGIAYATVDTRAAIGEATIQKGDETIIAMTVDENMEAQLSYRERDMVGTLVLAGAETDTMLFQLTNISYDDGSDASDVVFFLRMPRSGLNGDLGGVWMMYISQPSAAEMHSDWIITHDDGTADYGNKDKMNAITAQRFRLVERSETGWMWTSDNSTLMLGKKQGA